MIVQFFVSNFSAFLITLIVSLATSIIGCALTVSTRNLLIGFLSVISYFVFGIAVWLVIISGVIQIFIELKHA